MAITFVIPVHAESSNNANQYEMAEVNINKEEMLSNQKAGEIAFGFLAETLTNDSKLRNSKYDGIVDNYAGSMIDSEGKLVVYLADSIPEVPLLNAELAMSGLKESIQYVKVNYSYTELKEFQNNMWLIRNDALEIDGELMEWASKMISVAIDPEKNSVTVFENGFNALDYLLCETYFGNYPYNIETTSGTGEIQEQLSMKPGQAISVVGGGSMSIGFRCIIDGVSGFITSVHTSEYAGFEINSGTTKIGEVTKGIYDGKADFAFVELGSGHSVSLTTNTQPSFTLHDTNYVVALPKNYTVYLAGQKSTTARAGTVLYNDYAISKGTEWLVCDYQNQSGDSGGVVFALVNGDYCVYAVHNGAVSIGNDTATYATKFGTIAGYYSIWF